jgi:hypothetical protein
MKKAFRYLPCLLLAAFLFPAVTFAGGKPFEGVITYKISYPDIKATEAQMAMYPKVFTISIKGSKSRSELVTGMGPMVTITDYEAKTKVALMEMMGQKMAIKTTPEEIDKENADAPKVNVEYSSETKTIVGYLCKKAIVTTNEDGVKTTYTVFYTNELGGKGTNFDNPTYKDIDGVLMEFTLKTPQFSMMFTVTGVEKKSISAKEFDIPAEYKLTTAEELKSKFGGMEK